MRFRGRKESRAREVLVAIKDMRNGLEEKIIWLLCLLPTLYCSTEPLFTDHITMFA